MTVILGALDSLIAEGVVKKGKTVEEVFTTPPRPDEFRGDTIPQVRCIAPLYTLDCDLVFGAKLRLRFRGIGVERATPFQSVGS